MSDIAVGHWVKLVSSPDSAYEVLYVTNPNRAVIRYDMGAVVLVDRAADGTWDLSGQPASAEEKVIVDRYMPAKDTTEVDIVKD